VAEHDWLELWRELVVTGALTRRSKKELRYERRFRKKTPERPDPLLDLVMEHIEPRHTVLDIGAGSGRWTLPLAACAARVTAVEPSDAMLGMMRENIAEAGVTNISIVRSAWEEAAVEPHDIVTCVHGMYNSPDFGTFVRKMVRNAAEQCCFVLRFPPSDGILSELSTAIYGYPYDSPNAVIAWNALYSMGIDPNVQVEEDIQYWQDATFEEAFARAKRHLRLETTAAHDRLVRDMLERRLSRAGDAWVWPDGMRSALLWWKTAAQDTAPRPR
jgi:SAM-dependent methyltransferase